MSLFVKLSRAQRLWFTLDPHDAYAISEAMRECFANSVLRAELKGRGFRRLELFNWERTAVNTLASYRKALEISA